MASITSAVIWQPSTSSDVAWRQVSAVSLMTSMRVGKYGLPPPNSLMSRSRGKWRCQVSAGLCALPTCENLTSHRSGQAALMEIMVVSGIATLDGPCSVVNFGDARHILSNVSAVTQVQYKWSFRKPPCVLRTKVSSAAILSGERPEAWRNMQPAPSTRPMASTCRADACISGGHSPFLANPEKYPSLASRTHPCESARCANASPLLEVARKARNSFFLWKLYFATFVVRTSSGREDVVPILQ